MRETLLQQAMVPRRRGCVTWLAALVALWLCATAGEAGAGDPRRVWKTIETEHFVIHYYEPLLDVARRVAVAAEHSHTLLTPVFGHEPEEKTQIAIVDDTDGANGFANVIPRNRIRLFATAPTGGSTLNDHDDWLFILTAHEYAHVLHLDAIGGLARLVNKVVGKTWSPNQVQPRWIIEGIATFEESKQSSGGRVRSAIFDMNLRVVTLADEPIDLDALSNGPRAWPRGNAPYLYGSHFLDYVFSRYGHDALRELTWAYGSNPVPWSLSRTFQRITGRSLKELYADWLEHLRAKYATQVEAVERAGLRTGRRLTFQSEGNYEPRYSRDGQYIVWRQTDGYSEGRYRSMPVGGNIGGATDHVTIQRAGAYALLSDGSMVVEQANNYRSNYDFQDLFRWDRTTDTLERLTHGLRAREPAVSPDETSVAFVLNAESQSRLAVMPLRAAAEHRIVWEGGRFEQASMPAWSPDGSRVAFSAWTAGGYRDILVVDVDSGEVDRLMHDRAIDIEPVWSPDGAYIYFASDRSGIYNVYAFELESRALRQISNVLGGAFSPHVSPDGARLVYHGFGMSGYDLYEIALDPARWTDPVPYVNDRPDPVTLDGLEVATTQPRPYRALETLAPRSYTLQLGQNSFGRTLSVQTAGSDTVGLHAYSLGATLALSRGEVNFGASYRYHGHWPSLRAGVSRDLSRRSGVIIDGRNTPYTHESYRLTTGVGLPVLRTARGSAEIALDYDIDWLRNVGDEFRGHDPSATVPIYPDVDTRLAGLALRWGYSDVRGVLFGVGPRYGKSLSASLRFNHPAVGSDVRSLVLTYQGSFYQKLPWGLTPTLALRLAGGIRATENRRAGAFVLGGVPEQDLTRAILENLRAGVTGYLRGFPSRHVLGAQFHLANVEYRQELLEIERGLATLPFYVKRLHWAGLVDAGNAFEGELDLRDFHLSVGGALRLDMVFGYFIPGTLDIGYARGLTTGGINEYWMLLTGSI